MQESGKVAIARVVLRTKEQLVAIRPRPGDVLMMETMIFADEVVPPDEIEDLPDAEELKASDRELKMAQQLIDSLSSDFEPEKYQDEYREKVLELIERKAAGEEIAVQPEAPEPKKVPDLMAALEASLAAVKGDGGGDEGKKKKAPSSRKKKSREELERDLAIQSQRRAQPAVVGRDDERARPVLERGLEHLERRDVEVVGRLVEQQARRAPLREHGQLGPRALAGRERRRGPLGRVGAEPERSERRPRRRRVEAGERAHLVGERPGARERVAVLAELGDDRVRRGPAAP